MIDKWRCRIVSESVCVLHMYPHVAMPAIVCDTPSDNWLKMKWNYELIQFKSKFFKLKPVAGYLWKRKQFINLINCREFVYLMLASSRILETPWIKYYFLFFECDFWIFNVVHTAWHIYDVAHIGCGMYGGKVPLMHEYSFFFCITKKEVK